MNNEKSEIILYTAEDGSINIEVLYADENVWLKVQSIAELFDVNDKAIYKHIKNIYADQELSPGSTFSILESVGQTGQKYNTKYYNLDMIISIGFRVNSIKAIQFRTWANDKLKQYLIQGYALNKKKLMNKPKFAPDYFLRLLEEIKEIRTSERRFYQQITDIFKSCSIDYNKNSEITREFYATVQNKFHYAITGECAAEIIYNRVNSINDNMGLQSWENAPNGRILKSDVSIAKNYLNKKELSALQDIVNMYLDLAENRAKREIPMKMKDWISSVDILLSTNMYEILQNKGKISTEIAKIKAEEEYDKFRVIQEQKYISDFDEIIGELRDKNN